MRCEVCGRPITGKPIYVIIEGAKMLTCSKCAKLGEICLENKSKTTQPRIIKPLETRIKREKSSLVLDESVELVEDFNIQVRKAREKLGLTQEDLGRKIGEKVSIIRKIESGKIVPDRKLIRKLEHVLKIKLLSHIPEVEIKSTSPPRLEITLGDIVQFKKREKKREQS